MKARKLGLDAACGTGKYWPALLAAGLRVLGTDQSAGMLGQAGRKHPEVAVRVLLQDLAATADLAGRFDGLLCVDALECVAPEHWPGVAAGLAATVRTGAPAYVTVELWTGPLPAVTDPRQVPGEVIEDGGYHYYPSRPQVRQWLDTAGFTVTGQADDDDYWHLLLTCSQQVDGYRRRARPSRLGRDCSAGCPCGAGRRSPGRWPPRRGQR